MHKSNRFRFAIVAVLLAILLCLGPKLKDLGGNAGPDPRERAARENKVFGLTALRGGEWDLAIARFDEAIRLYAELSEQASTEAQSALRPYPGFADTNRFSEGIETLVNIKNEVDDLRLNRGIAYKGKGEYRKAINDFSAVIRSDSSPKAYDLRAETYRELGNETAADKDEEMAANLRFNKSVANGSSGVK